MQAFFMIDIAWAGGEFIITNTLSKASTLAPKVTLNSIEVFNTYLYFLKDSGTGSETEFQETDLIEPEKYTPQGGILGPEFIADQLIRAVNLKYSINDDIATAVNFVRRDILAGANYTIEDFIQVLRKQTELKAAADSRLSYMIEVINKYFIFDEIFEPKNDFEKRIAGYINTIISEHNSTLGSEEKSDRMLRLLDIVEARDKFPGDSFNRPWALLTIEFEDGTIRTYIFKKEVLGAMENWGYYMLKTLGIDASKTRKYGENLYLIVPIGKFNLGRVNAEQYLNHEFAERLSYLTGRAAVRAFILGLADRKTSNMRVILDDSGLPQQIINADLASSFTFSKKGMERVAVSEGVWLLGDILAEARKAGVSNRGLIEMIEKFMNGFRLQLSEFQDGYLFFKNRFDKYDPTNQEKLSWQWELAYQMQSRKSVVLDRINPLNINNYEINIFLLMEILLSLKSRKFFNDDDFLNIVFKKNEFVFEKTEDLFKMFRRQGVEFYKDNIKLIADLLEVFSDLAHELEKKEKYNSAVICYSYAVYISSLLVENVEEDARDGWRQQEQLLKQELKKIRAIIAVSEIKDVMSRNPYSGDIDFQVETIKQSI